MLNHNTPTGRCIVYEPGSDGVLTDMGKAFAEAPAAAYGLPDYTFNNVVVETNTGTLIIKPELDERDTGLDDWNVLAGDTDTIDEVQMPPNDSKVLLIRKKQNWTIQSAKKLYPNRPIVIRFTSWATLDPTSSISVIFGNGRWCIVHPVDAVPQLWEFVNEDWVKRVDFCDFSQGLSILSSKNLIQNIEMWILIVQNSFIFTWDKWATTYIYKGDGTNTIEAGYLQMDGTQVAGLVGRHCLKFAKGDNNYVESQLFGIGWEPVNAAEIEHKGVSTTILSPEEGSISITNITGELTDNSPISEFRYKYTLTSSELIDNGDGAYVESDDDGKYTPELYFVSITYPPYIVWQQPIGIEVLDIASISESFTESKDDWETTIVLENINDQYGSLLRRQSVVEWWLGYNVQSVTPPFSTSVEVKRGIGYASEPEKSKTNSGEEQMSLRIRPRLQKIKDYLVFYDWPYYDDRPIEFAWIDSLVRMGIPYHHMKIFNVNTGTYATFANEGGSDQEQWRQFMKDGNCTGHTLSAGDPVNPSWRPQINVMGWDWINHLVSEYFGWEIYADSDGYIVIAPTSEVLNPANPDWYLVDGQYTQANWHWSAVDIKNMFFVLGVDPVGLPMMAYYKDMASILTDFIYPAPENFIGYPKIAWVETDARRLTIEDLGLYLSTLIYKFGGPKKLISINTSGWDNWLYLYPGSIVQLATGEKLRVLSLSTSLDSNLFTYSIQGEYVAL